MKDGKPDRWHGPVELLVLFFRQIVITGVALCFLVPYLLVSALKRYGSASHATSLTLLDLVESCEIVLTCVRPHATLLLNGFPPQDLHVGCTMAQGSGRPSCSDAGSGWVRAKPRSFSVLPRFAHSRGLCAALGCSERSSMPTQAPPHHESRASTPWGYVRRRR